MSSALEQFICNSTGAKNLVESEIIQNLWKGYGDIIRYQLRGSEFDSVIVKHIKISDFKKFAFEHKTDVSHSRKLKSYKIESYWYENYFSFCNDDCRIPRCIASKIENSEIIIILEDLDASGFPKRIRQVSQNDIYTGLRWLANFHAIFMSVKPEGLWKTGTYWHLATRPDELNALRASNLKKAANKIDAKLQQCKYKTFVHGDAKLANFCFSKDKKHIAAVDFQYVGGGCGMKDVVYFIGSCMDDDEAQSWEEVLLDYYFKELKASLILNKKEINFDSLEKEWRYMYPIAWVDFYRFYKGWTGGSWPRDCYSERLVREVLDTL